MTTKNKSKIILGGVIIITCFLLLFLCNISNTKTPIKSISNGLHGLLFSRHFSNLRIKRDSIEAIYQFGDSVSDTGNFIWENPYSSFGQHPYGKTFFHKPVGRSSDGLLIIDYIAKFLKLPFLDPYLNRKGNFSHGVNFAVIGASALDTSTLRAKDIKSYLTNHSLSVQLDWFKSHLYATYSDASEWEKKLPKALFILGEIGANDYNYAIAAGKQPPDLYQMVPEVVQTISSAVEEIISLGATQIIVPGNFPMGCMTLYVAGFRINETWFYDEFKCIRPLNAFAKFHNDQLREAIKTLQKQYPHTTIVYMDLDEALMKILRHPTSLGFDKNGIFKTCCGNGDEEYNFNASKGCGTQGVVACEQPKKHVNWDGYHLTHYANNVISKWLINQIFDDCT